MDQSRLHAFEAQCTQEEPPACQSMCPLHVDVRVVARLMSAGKVTDARKTLERHMPLPGLMARLCEGPCMAHCRRTELDQAVNLPLIERACVTLSRPIKPMALPQNGKRAAILGAGFSALTLAYELSRKGYGMTVIHVGAPGGRLRDIPPPRLPETALPEALAMLESLRVVFREVDRFSPELLLTALEDQGAVYLCLDDPALDPQALGMGDGPLVIDPVTLETDRPRVFAGGRPGGCETGTGPSFVLEAADGKRAAGSLDRLLKGVAPGTAREKEGVYASTLYTDISGAATSPPVVPATPDAPTAEEAAEESRRCLQCECLECVKRCAYLARYKGYPKRYAREMYNNLSVVHGQRRANTQINSCAECGLCAAICPFGTDMGDFCVEARHEMVHSNRMPPRPHEFALQDMEFSNSADVGFFRHQPGRQSSAWAFFPGCQLPASMPAQTGAVYSHLCAHLDGGVGFLFSCCGAPARWSGRPQLTATTAAALRRQWEDAGKPRLILACSSCAAFFEAVLPDIPFRTLWEVLAEAPLPRNAAAASGQIFALHDPCVTRNKPAVQRSVRSIAARLGQPLEELPLGRDLTRCCGYGGLADFADPALGKLYAQDIAKDSPNTPLSYCIMCRDRIRAAAGPSLHLLDLLFPGECPDPSQAAVRPAPGISARQETRLAFRRHLLESLWQESPPRSPRMDDLALHIAPHVAELMEERRILVSDVKNVILYAQDNGAQFVNPGSGHVLSSLRPRQVTFWVEYTPEDDGSYTIHDAYCHRMVVPGVPGEGASSPCTLEGYSAKGGRM